MKVAPQSYFPRSGLNNHAAFSSGHGVELVEDESGWFGCKLLTGRRIFQLYRIQFSNTGVTGGLYTRLSQLS